MMSFDRDGETHRYSLQHMNRSVFRDPVSLMNNILHVTDYLKEQIRAQGGDSVYKGSIRCRLCVG